MKTLLTWSLMIPVVLTGMVALNHVDMLSAAPGQAPPVENAKPLSKQQLLELIQGGVPSQRAIELIRSRGIDFPADEDCTPPICAAPARTDQLISELRRISDADRKAS